MDLSQLSDFDKSRMEAIIQQKQMRDFMRLYSNLVDRCFADCVNDFTSKALSAKETSNTLLVKDLVGKTRPSVFDLPELNHVYGKTIERDPNETAATVLQHWHVRAMSKDIVPALDYVTMNRNTARKGILQPKEIRAYRKAHPVRIKVGDHDEAGALGTGRVIGGPGGVLKRKAPLPSDGNLGFTYGKPTRPSTPVADLMTDKYQREWMEEQQREESERAAREKEKKRGKKGLQPDIASKSKSTRKMQTVSSPLDNPLTDPSTLFKLSKFKKVGPTISSYREASDPAMTPCDPNNANPPPVFRVVRDKWLGQQPRIWEHGPPTGPLVHPSEATHTTVTMTEEKARGMGPVKIAAKAAEPLLFNDRREGRRRERREATGYAERRDGSQTISYEDRHALLAPSRNVQVERVQPFTNVQSEYTPSFAATTPDTKMRYIREVHPPTREVRYAPAKEVFHEAGELPTAAYRSLQNAAKVTSNPVGASGTYGTTGTTSTSHQPGTINTVATAIPTIGKPTQDLTNPAPPIIINTTATAEVPYSSSSFPSNNTTTNPRPAQPYQPPTVHQPQQQSDLGRRTVSFSDQPALASKAMPNVTRAGYTIPSNASCAKFSDLASRTRAPEGGKGLMMGAPPALPQKTMVAA
ncbi:hypothetical protein HK097_009783 [Rhizophlyctis rosea]|uniref:Uncharacterized protein n=1 Tax=Rhizophlyctis rosea TaxID=64517 RepID=A0AAD5X443_9FUNG|nr:hypothetical protein HK097_009783 [Rhizophlyctis rosea]